MDLPTWLHNFDAGPNTSLANYKGPNIWEFVEVRHQLTSLMSACFSSRRTLCCQTCHPCCHAHTVNNHSILKLATWFSLAEVKGVPRRFGTPLWGVWFCFAPNPMVGPNIRKPIKLGETRGAPCWAPSRKKEPCVSDPGVDCLSLPKPFFSDAFKWAFPKSCICMRRKLGGVLLNMFP